MSSNSPGKTRRRVTPTNTDEEDAPSLLDRVSFFEHLWRGKHRSPSTGRSRETSDDEAAKTTSKKSVKRFFQKKFKLTKKHVSSGQGDNYKFEQTQSHYLSGTSGSASLVGSKESVQSSSEFLTSQCTQKASQFTRQLHPFDQDRGNFTQQTRGFEPQASQFNQEGSEFSQPTSQFYQEGSQYRQQVSQFRQQASQLTQEISLFGQPSTKFVRQENQFSQKSTSVGYLRSRTRAGGLESPFGNPLGIKDKHHIDDRGLACAPSSPDSPTVIKHEVSNFYTQVIEDKPLTFIDATPTQPHVRVHKVLKHNIKPLRLASDDGQSENVENPVLVSKPPQGIQSETKRYVSKTEIFVESSFHPRNKREFIVPINKEINTRSQERSLRDLNKLSSKSELDFGSPGISCYPPLDPKSIVVKKSHIRQYKQARQRRYSDGEVQVKKTSERKLPQTFSTEQLVQKKVRRKSRSSRSRSQTYPESDSSSGEDSFRSRSHSRDRRSRRKRNSSQERTLGGFESSTSQGYIPSQTYQPYIPSPTFNEDFFSRNMYPWRKSQEGWRHECSTSTEGVDNDDDDDFSEIPSGEDSHTWYHDYARKPYRLPSARPQPALAGTKYYDAHIQHKTGK